MNERVLVTGATGNVGREVARALAKRGARVRAAVAGGAADRLPPRVAEVVPFDFTDPETFPAAFDGVTGVFLMRPPHIANAGVFRPAIDYAARAGVGQVAFLSLMGAERNPLVPHARIERLLRGSGMAWTMLRPSFFMQNLDTTHRADIVEHDELFIPAGRGRTAFIDARDIGAVAARVLTEPGHVEQCYTLTGGEALSYDEVAAIMSESLGRPIAYTDPSPLAFARRMRRRGHPWSYIAVMQGVYLTARLGLAAAVSPDAQQLLERPTITVREYVEDYAAAFGAQQSGG